MIKKGIFYLKRTQIQDDYWDDCIENSNETQIYALSWYLDIVTPDWTAFVQVNENGQYVSVIPLPEKKKMGIPYLKQPFFCQQLGVFTRFNTVSEFISEKILTLFQEKFSYVVDYTFNSSNSVLLDSVGFDKSATQYLILDDGYDKIFKGYNRDRKINLKRGIRDGLRIIEHDEIEKLIEIFREHVAHKIEGNVSEETYQILIKLFNQLKDKGFARLFYTVNEKGEKLTSGLFTIWKNRIIYLFNASTPEGKKRNGNTLIINEVIKEYSGQNYIFDFESTDLDLHWITGFYGSFGSEKVLLPQLKYDNLPLIIKGIKKVRVQVYKALKV
jgi:hypothetical protein